MAFFLATICAVVCSVSGLTADIQDVSLETKVEALSKTVQELKQTIAHVQKSLTSPIAFHAYLSKTYTPIGQQQQIIFDYLTLNLGNGYSKFSGHFTAPAHGLYMFHVMVTNMKGHAAGVDLLKNGQWLGSVLADDIPNGYVTSTLPVTVQLQVGDEVWVQNHDYSFSDVEELDGKNWSSFSGHLIFAY